METLGKKYFAGDWLNCLSVTEITAGGGGSEREWEELLSVTARQRVTFKGRIDNFKPSQLRIADQGWAIMHYCKYITFPSN